MKKKDDIYKEIQAACEDVMKVLAKQNRGSSKTPDRPEEFAGNMVVRADFAGPDSQYSHGLSVFFPWARPSADRPIMKRTNHKGKNKTEYEQYEFNQQTSWFSFLEKYWGGDGVPLEESTMRSPHKEENDANCGLTARAKAASPDDNLREDIVSLMFNADGPLKANGTLSGEKPNPQSSTGDGCACESIKNYKRDTRRRRERGNTATEKFTYPMNPRITAI